jgi:type I restriction enzyme S subunit
VKCIDDEIPFEIPQGWEWCRMGHIFNHASGKQQSSNNTKGKPHQFITTSNLYWGRFVLDNVKVMNFTDDEVLSCSATKGDLLVCEGGAGYGRSAIWSKDYDICLQNHIHRLRPYVFGICEYVYYFIYLLKESNRLASVGTAMPGLSANRLKSLIIPLPPLQEQARIVAKLEEVNHLIERYGTYASDLSELNSSINGLLHKSILQEAIQGKLVPQIESEGTAQELLEQIQQEKLRLVKEGVLKKSTIASSVIFKGDDNKYYEKVDGNTMCIDDELPFYIPNSWSWSRLGNITQLKIGKTPPRGDSRYWSNGAKPWVSISDMSKGQHITYTKEFISDAAAKDLFLNRISPRGSLLMSFKLSIGKVAILDIDAYHNEAIVTITPYFDNSYIFRDYLMLTLPFLSQLGESKDAIKGKTLNSKSLSNLPIPIPPLSEQLRILAKEKELTKLMKQ